MSFSHPTDNGQEKRYFTTEEVSDYIGLSKRSVYGLVARRQIPFIPISSKAYRFSRASIDKWLARKGEFLGMDTLIFEVTPAKLEEYRAKRISEGLNKATINREISVLKTAWNKAIEWGRATTNPVEKIKFYSEKDNARTRYLDQAEKVRLLNACPSPTKRIVFFALNTGIRLVNILGLKWKDIDPEKRL